ncbi:Transmembrane protein 132E [Liparis tanakae]|uniref:Transmembrane protein 132E n=1 Tax=Liparis tanakae TaxID=230148 RepID=A0A4Z2G004_9TELE|nr:Transmembrane protein 132E [Liparis tanakae]
MSRCGMRFVGGAQTFCRMVKAKKGVNLLETQSKNAQWKVDWEIQSGAKHSITTIDVNKNRAVKQG